MTCHRSRLGLTLGERGRWIAWRMRTVRRCTTTELFFKESVLSVLLEGERRHGRECPVKPGPYYLRRLELMGQAALEALWDD